MSEQKMVMPEDLGKKIAALGEAEMQLFRFMTGRPAGAILTYETDKLIARLLEEAGLLVIEPGDKVIIPADIRNFFVTEWTDVLEEDHRKHNWMYKCLEAAMNLYGVMTWEVLGRLFRLRYEDASDEEVKAYFDATPSSYQWFRLIGSKLVVNGFETDDYYQKLEANQAGADFYIPKAEEIEELYDQGSLISRESHRAMKDFIAETYGCGEDIAILKVKELYDAVNDHVRMSDAADAFAASGEDGRFEFPSDEAHVKFIEKLMEMSRECRVRDNRGHDYYEMVALMSLRSAGGAVPHNKKQAPVKRVKIGRNDPCPCGSGKKYKNCCGRNN